MKKAIITVVGKDTVGIIAKVCTFLSEKNINILDISQTTSGDRIDMMMVVDTERFDGTFKNLTDGLKEIGDSIGCSIKAQHQEIFDMMHRI